MELNTKVSLYQSKGKTKFMQCRMLQLVDYFFNAILIVIVNAPGDILGKYIDGKL